MSNRWHRHGTFKTESAAQERAEKLQKGTNTRTFSVERRSLTTASGGSKTRYTVRSEKNQG